MAFELGRFVSDNLSQYDNELFYDGNIRKRNSCQEEIGFCAEAGLTNERRYDTKTNGGCSPVRKRRPFSHSAFKGMKRRLLPGAPMEPCLLDETGGKTVLKYDTNRNGEKESAYGQRDD
jgi:hypothetical protein